MNHSGIPVSSLPRKIQDQIAATLRPVKSPEQLAAEQERPPAARPVHQHFVLTEEPMGKPRMTQSDKWNKREVVVRYRAYADRLRLLCAGINPDAIGLTWTAYFEIPKSWSKKKKEAMKGKLHRQKPDRDNVDKGILDALFKEGLGDQGIATGTLTKYWDDGQGPRLEIIVTG